MKKATKVIFIIAAVSAALGLLISIIAVAAGGMDVAKDIMIGDLDMGTHLNNNGEDNAMTFETCDITGLELEYKAGLVEIKEGETDRIVVSYKGKTQVAVENDVLAICVTDEELLHGTGMVSVQLPKNFAFENVEMQVGAAQTNIDGLKTKNFEFDLGAGSGVLKNVECDDTDIQIGAGEVIIENGTMKDVAIDVGVGNLEYHGVINKDLDVNCGMGNAIFRLNDTLENHDYHVKCAAGNVTVGETSYSGVAAVKTITYEHAISDYELKCGMGNISVLFE